ncbi:MAG: RHS repeat-associated core domain-containing protein, partial [Methylococcales bacterium]
VARTDHQAFGEEVGLGVGLRTIEQGYSVEKPTRQGYGLTENDDATGLNHTWFRKNENQAGRWTSPDPYKGSMSVGNPQSFNRYSYVQNEPTNFVDPSGLLMQTCELRGGEIVCFSSGGGYGADHGYGGNNYRVRSVFGDNTPFDRENNPRFYQMKWLLLAFGGYNPRERGGGTDDFCNNVKLARLDPDVKVTWGSGARGFFDPTFAKTFSAAIRDLNSKGIVPQINSDFRTAADQQRMRSGGSGSNPAAAGVSLHQTGNAVDINGTLTKDFVTVRAVMANHGFVWGGVWNRPDPPHFQSNPHQNDAEKQSAASAAEDYYTYCAPYVR